MAGALRRAGRAYAIAVDRSSGGWCWQQQQSIAPITIAKLLRQWRAIRVNCSDYEPESSLDDPHKKKTSSISSCCNGRDEGVLLVNGGGQKFLYRDEFEYGNSLNVELQNAQCCRNYTAQQHSWTTPLDHGFEHGKSLCVDLENAQCRRNYSAQQERHSRTPLDHGFEHSNSLCVHLANAQCFRNYTAQQQRHRPTTPPLDLGLEHSNSLRVDLENAQWRRYYKPPRGILSIAAMAYAAAGGRRRGGPWTEASPYSSQGKFRRTEFETIFTKQPGMDPVLPGEDKLKKVTVVGVGNVGMACAQTILTDNLTDAIALVDVDPDKLRGEMLDLQHAAAFMPTVSIAADVDYRITANSDVCIITAGARQVEGEDRLSLVDRNVQVFKSIIPKLVKHSPNTIFLVISNPVDILSWVTWKLSGFPPNRVIGSGTNLDSSRFRFILANHFRVSAQNVHAHILGEHGDSSVPVWSSVRVAGVPVTAFLLNKGESADPEVLRLAHKAVVDGAYEVIRLKGYTSWAIGYSAAGLVSTVLRNQRRVHPVSIMAQGFHGIKQEVYLSLPAMLGRMGVHAVVNSVFEQEEIRQLHESAAQLWDIQSKLKL